MTSKSSLSRSRCFWIVSWLLVCLGILQAPASASENSRYIKILDLKDGSTQRLTQVVGRPNMGSPAWSNDGTQIAFDACGEDGDFSRSHLYVVRSDGTWPRDLGPGAVPSWSSDGGQIAYHLYGEDSGVWIVNVEDNTIRSRVATDGGSPRFRPHRGTLGYLQWGRNIAEIDWYERDSSGQPKVRPLLPASLTPYWGWSWSPDGDGVCFMSRRSGNSDKRELLIVRLNEVAGAVKESQVVSHVTGPIYTHVSWSPDGKKILLSMKGADDSHFQLYTVNPDGKEQPARVAGQCAECHNVDATWSPDGKKIAYVVEGCKETKKAEAEPDDLVTAEADK